MSARDIHLRCLIKSYKEIKEREKEDYLKETDEQVYKINSSYSLFFSIFITSFLPIKQTFYV